MIDYSTSKLRAIVLVFICSGFSYLGISQQQTLEFIETINEDSIYLDLRNYMYGPVLLKFNYKKAFKDDVKGPDRMVINARECVTGLISIPRSIVKDTAVFTWREIVEVTANLGDPDNSSHNDSILYNLPFPEGKSYKILQSWNGKFSHQSKASKYAIDFTMPEGDTICAARSGTVIRIEDQYSENGGEELRDKANQIVVLHDDGTMAFYVHLLHNGVLVQPGDSINAGQSIGLSGNTGYSTRPHLHFVVREAPDKAVPIYFMGFKDKVLKKGMKVGH